MVKLADIRKMGTLAAVNALPTEGREIRTYLGMSEIGHQCNRYLWFSFRWAFTEKLTSRQVRLFSRGNREEPIIVAELARIGVECYDTGDDQAGYSQCLGHHSGHSDGKAKGVLEAPKTIHLAEFKTINDKGFKELLKKKLKLAKPIYYAQIQSYMREEGLTRGLFIAVNKNDDSWYVERVYFDKGYAEDLLRKAEDIIFCGVPEPRQFPKGWYECGYCDAREKCSGAETIDKSCRTCIHAAPIPGGLWHCDYFSVDLDKETQLAGVNCPDHYMIEL